MKKNKTSKPPKTTVKNPFYERIRREGFQFVLPPPKRPRGRKRAITNPYYERIVASGGVTVHVPMGRPHKHERARPTIVKSFRVAPDLWKMVRERAEHDRVTMNAIMREALVNHLRSP
jgi:hypothetical protein